MSVHGALVDAEDSTLALVRRAQVADLQTAASLDTETVEGLFPFGVG